ncbi:MAG: hypothetical protein GWP16_03605 [Nitrospirae bacterium]|nr:hypothetical protein [Nitrospirota bacterium]
MRPHLPRLVLLVCLSLAWAGSSLAQGPPPSATTAESAGRFIFSDSSLPAGFDFHLFNGASGEIYFLEIMGSGGGLIDYDGDGDLDLYAVQGTMLAPGKGVDDADIPPKHPVPLTDRLYRNDLEVDPQGHRALRFTDVTEKAGLTRSEYGFGVATGDYDNDGWTDLYVTNFGSNQLLRNNGDGTFSDRTEASGVDDKGWSVSASFVDFDRDGWLDLYVTNYVDFSVEKRRHCLNPMGAADYCDPDAYPSGDDHLFRNRGDGTFEDVSIQAGIRVEPRTGLGVASADFDLDGWPDLYVANDGMSNLLFMNNRDGTFRDDTLLAGCAVNAEGQREASMGVHAADVDNDGDEDIFLTHYARETNTLYVNDGTAMFDDVTQAGGLATPSWNFTSFGTHLFDFDNDGLLDIMTVSGAVTIFSNGSRENLAQTNQLFRNLDGRQFEDVSDRASEAFHLEEVSRGAAFGDLDNDGDTDVVVFNNSEPSRLLVNQVGSERTWLGLRLVGKEAPRDMHGAWVELEQPAGPTLWRRVNTDGSYASASDPRLLFGLADRTSPATARVSWPSGLVEEFGDLSVGQYTELKEGTGRVVE